MSEPSFPQFSRLPFELRDAIWVTFALPRGPMLHSLSEDYYLKGVMLCSFDASGSGSNLSMVPTTRALMQVNKEARKAVLAGRQLESVRNEFYGTDVFFGGLYKARESGRQYLMLYKFFFVNWNIDMFYFCGNLCSSGAGIFREDQLCQVKHLAIPFANPITTPGASQLWNLKRDLARLCPWSLSSLETVQVVLDFHTMSCLYTNIELVPNSDEHSGTHYVVQGGEDNNEDEGDLDQNFGFDNEIILAMEYADPFFFYDSPRPNRTDPGHSLLGQLPEDQYGFYILGLESQHRLPIPPSYSFWDEENPGVQVAFQKWVAKMKSILKKDAEVVWKRPIDAHIVLDLDGYKCRELDGFYYRRYIDFYDVDAPAPGRSDM